MNYSIKFTDKPTTVCLVGSTKYEKTFRKVALDLTMEGKVVLSLSFNLRTDLTEIPADITHVKAMADAMYKYKINMADEVMVINVGGYVGDTTRDEIEWAKVLGKKITYLEPVIVQAELGL